MTRLTQFGLKIFFDPIFKYSNKSKIEFLYHNSSMIISLVLFFTKNPIDVAVRINQSLVSIGKLSYFDQIL